MGRWGRVVGRWGRVVEEMGQGCGEMGQGCGEREVTDILYLFVLTREFGLVSSGVILTRPGKAT